MLAADVIVLTVTNTTISKNQFGGMYGFAFMLILLLLHFLLFCKYLFTKIYSYLSKRMALVILFILLLSLRYVYEFKMLKSCKDWEKGLNGTMQHSGEFCEIRTPMICPYELTDRIQDLSFSDCSYQDKNKDTFQNFYNT